jgi:hypothetical protein
VFAELGHMRNGSFFADHKNGDDGDG